MNVSFAQSGVWHKFFIHPVMDKDQNKLQENVEFSSTVENKEEVSIPVINEQVSVNKTLVETGKIRVVKKVTEEYHTITIPLVHEEVDVKTVMVNQFVDTPPEAVRYEGDTMIIPVLKEVSVVRILVEKEIHVTKKKNQVTDSQTISLRKESIEIENTKLANSQDEPRQNR